MAEVVVRGEVADMHKTGTGFRLRESWESRGEVRSRYWSVFPRQGEAAAYPGQALRVEGRLQAKVAQNPKFVDLTVGDATMQAADRPGGPQGPRGGDLVSNTGSGGTYDSWAAQTGAQANASSDPWAPIGGGSDDAPF